jgi:phosphoglycerol transferase MdoB-like AlkP superfamily enzyme
MMKAMKLAMMYDAIMMIIMVTDMVMMGLAMVMVEMDLEQRKAVNMAEEKKRKIKNVTIAVKLTVCVVVALHVVEISVFVFVLNVVISLAIMIIIMASSIISGFIAFIIFTTSTIQWKFFTSYALFCMASPLCVTLFSTSFTYKVWALSLVW